MGNGNVPLPLQVTMSRKRFNVWFPAGMGHYREGGLCYYLGIKPFPRHCLVPDIRQSSPASRSSDPGRGWAEDCVGC